MYRWYGTGTFPTPRCANLTRENCVLDVRGLTKKYRNRAVVDHVTFTVPPGQVTGYLGPNGSGKSTTVKMLAGLLPASAGQILWNGADIRHDLTSFKRILGYVPEEAF